MFQFKPIILPEELPDDPEVLKAMLIENTNGYNTMGYGLMEVQRRLAQFEKYLFGRRSERFIPTSSGQLLLGDVADLPTQESDSKQTITYQRRRKASKPPSGHGRIHLPEGLPGEDIIIDLPEAEKYCHGEPKRVIGEEVTIELEYHPGSFFVKRTHRPKYTCADKDCEILPKIAIAPLPPRVIPKGIPAPSLLSYILVSKIADHLPLHRLEKIFRRSQIRIPRSTMCDWLESVGDLITPVFLALWLQIRASGILHGDESPLKVQSRGSPGGILRGFMWVFVGGEQVAFHFAQGRGQDHPAEFLKGYRGSLQTDAYAGYNLVERVEGLIRLGCWAHARRAFVEALETEPILSEKVILLIGELYRIESEAKDLVPEARLAKRKQESQPVLDKILKFLEEQKGRVLPQSPFGRAVSYTLAQWPGLIKYAQLDGRYNIDNNPVENAIRPLALGRKNYLFAGSVAGAERLAMFYSLIGSCHLQGIEPYAYFKCLLETLAMGSDEAYADLTPLGMKKSGRLAPLEK